VPESQRTYAGAAGIYLVAVLFLVNIIGYLDRQILVLVVGPIKTELGLTDAMVGLAHGAAFVVTYTIAGLFLGSLIDRYSRRNLLVVCVLMWSAFTSMVAFVDSGTQLFLTRMGVGIGEAALVPAAVSLISSCFEPERRGRALSVFMVGAYVGAGASLVMAGLALPLIESLDLSGTPLVGMSSWRLLMMSMVIPGVIAAVLLLTLREPSRHASFEATSTDRLDLRSGLRVWTSRWSLYGPHHIGFALLAFCSFGLHAWAPTALIREHQMLASETGLTYGMIVAATGALGALLGGWLGDRAAVGAGRLHAARALSLVAAIGFAGVLLHRTPVQAMAAFGLTNIGLSGALVVGLSSITDIAEERIRGLTSAIYLLFAAVIGMGAAPFVIGKLNDTIGGPSLALSTILATASLVALAVGWLLIRSINRAPRAALLRAES
jgi:MFS family permease